jgi:predicted house-cleaning noncanonical NTP pyrophosphatase (MazG superfamily)
MAKELLKEAIADAKAVREVALQNAKMALEEAFDSKIKNMLSAKLAEEIGEDVLDEDYLDEEMDEQ